MNGFNGFLYLGMTFSLSLCFNSPFRDIKKYIQFGVLNKVNRGNRLWCLS